MSRAESLSLELESARLELERLKAENAKLRAAKEIEVTAPSDETEQLYQQAVSDLAQKDDEIARLRGNLDAAKEEHRQLSVEMKVVKDQAELELHRALAKERERWEQREERLVKQLKDAQQTSGTNREENETTSACVGGDSQEGEDGGQEEIAEQDVTASTRRLTPQSVPPLSSSVERNLTPESSSKSGRSILN